MHHCSICFASFSLFSVSNIPNNVADRFIREQQRFWERGWRPWITVNATLKATLERSISAKDSLHCRSTAMPTLPSFLSSSIVSKSLHMQGFHILNTSSIHLVASSPRDDPIEHRGRVRKQPHMENSWATYVYLEGMFIYWECLVHDRGNRRGGRCLSISCEERSKVLIWNYSASEWRDPTNHWPYHPLRQCPSYHWRGRKKAAYQLKPLYLSQASSIGAFCAINTRPRE